MKWCNILISKYNQNKEKVHRIFGAEEETVKTMKKRRARSLNELQEKTSKKQIFCKSVESLEDVRLTRTDENLRREWKTILRVESEESPASLSPGSPDKPCQLQPESPTKGLGQWAKGRSSSIATTAAPVILFPIRGKLRPRRFSVDSQFPRQRMMRMFLKDKKVTL